MDTGIQDTVNIIFIIVIVVCIIAMLIFLYNKSDNQIVFHIIHAIPIIFAIILIAINEALSSLSVLSVFSFGLLLVKFFISVVAVSNLNNYYPDSPFKNYFANMKDILTNAYKDNNIYLSVFSVLAPPKALLSLL